MADGFGSPIGTLKGINLPIEDMAPRDLEAYGIYEGKTVCLEFENGVRVKGKIITGTRDRKGKILLITLADCTVTYQDQVLFKPEWGLYDMAIGKEVVSAYAGPADVDSFGEIGKISETKTHKIAYSNSQKELYSMYSELRTYRDNETATSDNIEEIFNKVRIKFPTDWLLPLELYELATKKDLLLQDEIYSYLNELMNDHSLKKLVKNGLEIINNIKLQSA